VLSCCSNSCRVERSTSRRRSSSRSFRRAASLSSSSSCRLCRSCSIPTHLRRIPSASICHCRHALSSCARRPFNDVASPWLVATISSISTMRTAARSAAEMDSWACAASSLILLSNPFARVSTCLECSTAASPDASASLSRDLVTERSLLAAASSCSICIARRFCRSTSASCAAKSRICSSSSR